MFNVAFVISVVECGVVRKAPPAVGNRADSPAAETIDDCGSIWGDEFHYAWTTASGTGVVARATFARGICHDDMSGAHHAHECVCVCDEHTSRTASPRHDRGGESWRPWAALAASP